MQIELVPINSLVFDPSNARKHNQKNINAIKGSLARFKQQKPIVVNYDNVVIAGNGTLQAAIELKWKDIAVVRTDLDGSDLTAFGLADNRSSELAEWDLDNLGGLLKSLQDEDFNLDSIGFDNDDLQKMIAQEIAPGNTDDDAVPEDVETRCKPGDLWILGNHRLLCGDSTNVQHVERLMNGEKADMVFTDPPYGMNLDTDFSNMPKGEINQDFEWRNGSGNAAKQVKITPKKYLKIKNDDIEFDPNLILNEFGYCKEIFLFGADYYIKKLPNTFHLIIWDKTTNESADKSFGSNFEIVWSKEKHKKDFCRVRSGVFGVKDDCKKRIHPTQKPVQVAEWFFDRYNKHGHIVVDLFLGSGSTLIACEKTNRKCYAMEIDQHYCDVILRRWEDYTGKQAILDTLQTG